MSVASWFRIPKLHFASPLTKSSRRATPIRPMLETLEERAVPATTTNGLLGGVNNANNFNAFNTQQSGLNLATNPAQLNGLAVGFFPNEGTPNALGPAIGGMSSFLAQDQLGEQFRALGVNSTGQQGTLNQFTPNSIFFNAYGFGSGTQPNQPWVPNAYNLGLANGQMAFPTMADFGSFQSFGIRYPRFSHLRVPANDNNREQLEPPLPRRDAWAYAEMDTPETNLPDADNVLQAEEDVDGADEALFRPIPIVPHAATVDENAVLAARRMEESFTEPVPQADGENAEALELAQAEQGMAFAAVPQATVFTFEEPAAAEEGHFLDSDLVHDVPALESLNLPSTLLLTVLTPAQLMLLMAEFPVGAAPAEASEVEEEELSEVA